MFVILIRKYWSIQTNLAITISTSTINHSIIHPPESSTNDVLTSLFFIFPSPQDFATLRKNKFARRCSSLRQQPTGSEVPTTASSVTLELESASPAQSMTIHQPSAMAPTSNSNSNSNNNNNNSSSSPKKPKWEVIEHFKSTGRGQESISSSLIAVSYIYLLWLGMWGKRFGGCFSDDRLKWLILKQK